MLKKSSASTNGDFNFDEFDREWTNLGIEISQEIYNNPIVQQIKLELSKNGFLSLEEKSQFINISNDTKYKLIYKKYGQPDTKGYQEFSKSWQQWFQSKGVESQKNRALHSCVDHILFGSTPDPVEFINHFEEEIDGANKKRQ